MSPALKTERAWVLKVQENEARSTEFKVSSPEFVSVYFCKVTTLESVLLSYFSASQDIIVFHVDHATPSLPIHPSQNLGVTTLPPPKIDAWVVCKEVEQVLKSPLLCPIHQCFV